LADSMPIVYLQVRLVAIISSIRAHYTVFWSVAGVHLINTLDWPAVIAMRVQIWNTPS
jgi:hypothetical protein